MPIVSIVLSVVLLFDVFSTISSTISSEGTLTSSPFLSSGLFLGLFMVLGIIGFIGIILFLVGMHRLGEYYQEPRIFTNALYGFLTSIIGGIVVAVIFFAVIIASIGTLIPATGTPSTTSFALGFLGAILGLGIGIFIVLIISAIFYMRAFNLLGEKSGVHSFNTAGTLYIVGSVLQIVGIGALLVWIAWIFASSGFNSLKPKPTETATTYSVPNYFPPTATPPPTIGQKMFCPQCGAENNVNSDYCWSCGKQLR